MPFNAADLANITKANPYIQRLIEDSKLRDNVRTALDSSKSAYERLSNGKAPHRAVLEDKKLQADLRGAAEAIREATLSLTDAPKRQARKRRRLGRKLMIAFVGAVARAGREREAALEGARHAVRSRGGVPVHAAGRRGDDAPGDSGHRRVALAENRFARRRPAAGAFCVNGPP